MSTKKAKNTKLAKNKPVTVAKKAKSVTKASASTKKVAQKAVEKKAIKSKLSNKSNSKPTKEKKLVKKLVSKNIESKSISKKTKSTKPLKVVEKKAVLQKGKKNENSNKSKIVLAEEEKALKAKKDKIVDGIQSNKIKAANTASKPKRSKKKKKGDDDDEPAIDVDDALLAEILETVKPKKKNTKEVKQIRTFVNPMASLTVAKVVKDGAKAKAAVKEPKGKFILEFVLGTSPAILYEFLTTPSGLSEWFSDDVNIHDGIFTFYWEGSEQKALLLDFKEEKFIRFQWIDKPQGTYFEFKIEVDELTGDVSLMVTDFADEGSDLETSKRLWDSQIHTLMHVIGSY